VDEEYNQLLRKYKEKIKEEFGENAVKASSNEITSKHYDEFKSEFYPAQYTFYEKSCNFSAKILNINFTGANADKLKQDLETCHLNTTPTGVMSFSIIAPIIVILVTTMLAFVLPPLLFGVEPMIPLVLFMVIGGMLLSFVLQKLPSFMANSWKMKASNQMVQSIFYMVTYMRHTSNLERAIQFSANHLSAPLSIDFKKIMWDVQTGKHSNVRDSANTYLELWQDSNKDFVEAFHLLESSLFESTEDRRVSLLDKALDVILNGTYESMLHYAHSLKSPITMLHMLGVILPILGLVILPLIVSFMGSTNPFVSAIYIAFLYNLVLPISVFYLGKNILSKRPSGYGAEDISEDENFKHLKNINFNILGAKVSLNPLYICIIVFTVLAIVGLSPLILHSLDPTFDLTLGSESFKLLQYVCPPENAMCGAGQCGPNCLEEYKIGPFGLGSAILSLVFVAGFGLSIGLYYSLRSKNVIDIREKTKRLEEEFSSALFQLGNRLADGLPAEMAFSKVADTMRNSTSGDFFRLTERNIARLGMGLDQALFDPKVGSVRTYPSKVIESSMKVLSESIKKGPKVAARALLSMSRYIKQIHRVEERLKDLMGEVISSMKSQIRFMTPAIAGIVIGITSMISLILTNLAAKLQEFGSGGDIGGLGGMVDIFGIGMPTYHFQIVVGIYVVQIAYILTTLSSGIENGSDKAGERFELGKNLIGSTLLYTLLAATVIILFNFFAVNILQTL
jgi:Flp pilus assembly protein TadB